MYVYDHPKNKYLLIPRPNNDDTSWDSMSQGADSILEFLLLPRQLPNSSPRMMSPIQPTTHNKVLTCHSCRGTIFQGVGISVHMGGIFPISEFFSSVLVIKVSR